MANDQTNEEIKDSRASKKKALVALIIGVAIVSVLLLFLKKESSDTSALPLSQDSFQGPTELSATILATCQESAKKIFEEKNCADKKAEYLKNATNCLNVYYSIDHETNSKLPEGNYGDIALDIAECYSVTDQSNSSAANWLKDINESQDWDIYMGPISCDSKSTLAAYIERYSTERSFRCIKTPDLHGLISDIKNKNFKSLFQMIGPTEVLHQGIIEADVSCPETMAGIQKNLEQILSQPFEIIEPKLEAGAPDDVFLEFVRNNNRIINLQFKVNADGCLHFQSLLAPSTETE